MLQASYGKIHLLNRPKIHDITDSEVGSLLHALYLNFMYAFIMISVGLVLTVKEKRLVIQ